MGHEIQTERGYFPIVYVRGYARTHSEREEVFNDTYYGFAATSVEKRQGLPDKINNTYLQADVFEGQLIRFMKLRGYAYADAMNQGLEDFHNNPSRSLWISRFYDQDYINGKMRTIEEHAAELADLVLNKIPQRLINSGVSEESVKRDYKVILIAHSMGGLVCRTFIQNLLVNTEKPLHSSILEKIISPKSIVHRLITMGTPHRGIDMGNIPDWIEDKLSSIISPESDIFREERMRKYLRLSNKDYDLHSLGDADFPVKRCFCLIGSDHRSYIAARHLTGSFSDGLVRQDNAYIVKGAPVSGVYPASQTCFYANVHRAHSGPRGIVNSYESFENIHRFLFGNIRAEISLADLKINTEPPKGNVETFFDIDFRLSIRGTSSYLHRREQEPCENAIRITKQQVDKQNNISLHTAFLNSDLKQNAGGKSHFSLAFKIVEYHVKSGLFWDKEYPGRTIYSETAEIRLRDITGDGIAEVVEYRWLSDVTNWESDEDWLNPSFADGTFHIQLREAKTLSGKFTITASVWPGPETEDK